MGSASVNFGNHGLGPELDPSVFKPSLLGRVIIGLLCIWIVVRRRVHASSNARFDAGDRQQRWLQVR